MERARFHGAAVPTKRWSRTWGVSLLHQTFETAGLAPPRTSVAGRGSALVTLRWDLPRGLFVMATTAARVLVFARQRGNEAESSTAAAPVLQFRLGLGKWF